MALITVTQAGFSYEKTQVISGLQFQVQQGDYLCIVGENGSGKSTLLKGLLSLLRPATGRIQRGDGLQAKEIGYLPQQTAAQKDFPASVEEVVRSGLLNRQGLFPFFSKANRAEATRIMTLLDITKFQSRCYRELSGGQQQRVLLARALCAGSRLLLLDEPVSGLDPVVTQELYGILQTLNRDLGLTIVMVSHDVQSAVRYASHILHLDKTQVFFGKAADYRQTQHAQKMMGRGMPQ